MIQRLGIATECHTILESPEQASNTQNRRFLIFVPQLEFSMFQTFDFRCVQTLATTAPGYRGGVYVINVTYSRKLRSVAPPFYIMLYIVNNLSGVCNPLLKLNVFWKAQSKPRKRKIVDF